MDYLSVGMGTDPVEIGDEAIVLGGTADAGIPAEEAAGRAGSLSYEMLVRVGERVPRLCD